MTGLNRLKDTSEYCCPVKESLLLALGGRLTNVKNHKLPNLINEKKITSEIVSND